MHTGLGLHITRRLLGSVSGASALLAGETDGLAFDFTNQSALIRDTSTPANAYNSIGIVNDGELVGPSGKLTYTSPSNKLTLQADGYYKYQAHNLCQRSETLTASPWVRLNSAWSTSVETPPSPYATASTLTDDTANNRHILYQQFTLTAGAAYSISAVLKAGTTGYAALTFDGGSANAYAVNVDLSTGTVTDTNTTGTVTNPSNSVTDLGGGWYRVTVSIGAVNGGTACYFTIGVSTSATPTWASASPSFTGTGTNTIHVTGCVLRRTPANTEYIKTTTAAKYALPLEYDTSGTCLGLLVEEQRTNTFANNTTPSTYMSAGGGTFTDNNATSPTGLTDAQTFVASATTDFHRVFVLSIGGASSTGCTISTYIKAVDTSGYYVGIRESNTSGSGAVFDPSNGFAEVGTYITGAVSAVTTKVKSVGNGWYRISATFTSTAMQYGVGIVIVDPTWTTGTFLSSWALGSTKQINLWGITLEEAAFPTSPILTYGAAATRAADNISIATNAFPFSSTVGALYSQFTTPLNLTASGSYGKTVVCLGQASGLLNTYSFSPYLTNNRFTYSSETNNTGTAAVNTTYKQAGAWAANDVAHVIDGGTVVTDNTHTLSAGITNMYVGNFNGLNGGYFGGHIKAISYVPRRKDDIELAVDTGYSLPTGYTTYGAWDLFGDESSALAFDFTDQSVVNTKTPLVSQGIVSDGELVGPGAALTYTSPSNKLTRQSDGYYKYQAHNLCLQSEDFTTTWGTDSATVTANTIAAPDGNSTADTLTEVAASARHIVYQINTNGVAGAIMRFSVYLKSGTAQYAAIGLHDNLGVRYTVVIDLSNGTIVDTESASSPTNTDSSVVDVGDGWFLCTVQQTVTHGTIYPTIGISDSAAPTYAAGMPTYLGTNKTLYVWGAHVYRYPANTDYIRTTTAAKYAIPLEYDTSGNCLGLLAEEQRTNLLTYSTDFTNAAWSPDHDGSAGLPTVTSNTTVAPDGTTTADTFAVPAVSGAQWSYVTQTAVCTAVAHTISVWLKGSVGGETVYLAITPDGVNYVSRSCTLTTEWQRFDVTGTLTNTTWYYLIGTDLRDGTQSATSAQTFYVWQAQIEVGSFPTSPILTYGAAATRNVDDISIARTLTPLPDMTGASDAMSIFAETIGTLADGSSDYYILNIDAGANTNRLYLYYNNTTEAGWGTATTDAGAQTLFELATMNAAQTQYKFAARWKNDDCAVSFENETQATDTSVDVMGSAITTIRIGSAASNGGPYNGIIRKIALVPSAWSNATLEEKVGN